MTPKEQNILDTLHLLVLLFRARKQHIPKLDELDQHVLRVTKEHLAHAKLSTPVFANTLTLLDQKGYLIGLSVFGKDAHEGIDKFLDDAEYEKILAQIDNLDGELFVAEGKEKIAEYLTKLAPANYEMDKQGFIDEPLTIRQVLGETREALRGHTDEEVSLVMLYPFRSIERLLEKMNDGMSFDEIQDAGVWYDAQKYKFHFGDESVDTQYQGKPNREHFILTQLLHNSRDSVVDYMDVEEFKDETPAKRNKACSDALHRFIKKHPRLPEIFVIHSDHLEIKEEHLEHTH